jgi:hypothetical protein
LSSPVRIIEGDRYIFFFPQGPDFNANDATAWVNNMSPDVIAEAKHVAAASRRDATIDLLAIALGVPMALLLTWLLGLFVFRGFRPKGRVTA